jgi:LysR family transcriptional activator of mexEF-oprN operon
MSDFDPTSTDLNLLTVFATLMRERSVTRAATQLRRGQPAVSHSLRQLRDMLGDPLFTRAGRAIEPTARAIELYEQVAPALAALAGAIRATRRFDPETAAPSFRLGLTDDLQLMLLPAIARRLRSVIPQARLVVRGTDYIRAFAMLESGEISTLIGHAENLPAQAKLRTLRRVPYRVLRAREPGDDLDLDGYCRRPHALVSSAGDLSGVIDDVLRRLGRSRRVVVSLPLFGAMPALIAGSDLVATLPAHLAEALGHGPLRCDGLPFDGPSYTLSLAWRLTVDRDPAEMRFRALLLEAVQAHIPGVSATATQP